MGPILALALGGISRFAGLGRRRPCNDDASASLVSATCVASGDVRTRD